MGFELVDATVEALCRYVDQDGRRGRLWPVYQTSELLMSRLEIAGESWRFAADDLSYFIFVESGSVAVDVERESTALLTRRGLEIPERCGFKLTNHAAEPAYVVLVAGKELLPGSFFNSFNNAYLNA